MSKKLKEANIISWKLVIDERNVIHTELSAFPEEKVEEIFGEDAPYIHAILANAKISLEPLHENLRKYLSSL
jgi:hypothetical protein|tara:strand:- start:8778 stop:8993 length:216 start_codon:yes stop_codon:yes gene_type:complete